MLGFSVKQTRLSLISVACWNSDWSWWCGPVLATTATENLWTQQPCHVHGTAFPALLHISSSEILSTYSVKSLETWRGWGREDLDVPLRSERSPVSCFHWLRFSGLVLLTAREASQAKVLPTYKEQMTERSVFYFGNLAQSAAVN